MKKHLQRILFLLVALSLVFSAVSALSEETEARVITITWMDGNNYDGLRPDHVYASLEGQKATMTEANGWTDMVTVPKGTGDNWTYDAVEGYTVADSSGSTNGVYVLVYSHSVPKPISVSGRVVKWEDNNNAKNTRPKSVDLMLYADGAPYGEPLKATPGNPAWTVTWQNLPKRWPKAAADSSITYTVKPVQDPQGYTSSSSGKDVTFTLQTAGLSVNASVSGAPEGTDLSGLKLLVDGPDPDMPQWLTWDQISGGTYSFGQVLPGAYLIRDTNADTLVEGYFMDAANSKVCDAVYVRPGKTETLEFKYTYKEPENINDLPEEYDPWQNVGNLTFEILGPDPRLPITVPYSKFNEKGQYELENLVPGVYTVVERNAERLVNYYYLTSDSITALALTVDPNANEPAVARLVNKYTPVPTPEPDAEMVDIPVTKTWNDNGDQDGNRPDSITARLYADGVEVDSHVLTAAENWSYTFKDKPRYQEDNRTEIVYTVNEDAVAMYTTVVNGYNIVNNYTPEETSRSVRKIWQDRDNEQRRRPVTIAMTLSNQVRVVARVILSEENNWKATVHHLPTVVNGKPAVYTWKEQEVLGYHLVDMVEADGVTTFTNALNRRGEGGGTPGKQPRTAGETTRIDDYDTPLGVDIMINHVGDCFD